MTTQVVAVSVDDPLFPAVARLRYRVYAEEEGQDLPGMNHRDRLLVDELDPVSHIFAALEDGRVVGTLRATPVGAMAHDDDMRDRLRAFGTAVAEEHQLLVGRLMVDPLHRGGPACPLLFASAYRGALEKGYEVAFAECSPHNVPLYESVGCRLAAPAFFDPLYGLNVLLALLVRDLAHLARVQSPLLALASRTAPNEPLARWFDRTCGARQDPLSLRLKPAAARQALLDDIVALPQSPFAGLGAGQLGRVTRSATVFDVEAGTDIVAAGCACTETFLVLEGEVRVEAGSLAGGEASQRLLGPGAVFNERSLLAGRALPTCVAARATARTKLLAMSAESFGALRKARPEIAAEVEVGLRRLVASRDRVDCRAPGGGDVAAFELAGLRRPLATVGGRAGA